MQLLGVIHVQHIDGHAQSAQRSLGDVLGLLVAGQHAQPQAVALVGHLVPEPQHRGHMVEPVRRQKEPAPHLAQRVYRLER